MTNITIICGDKHSGKTTKLKQVVSKLQSQGKYVSGIIALGAFKNNQRYSFLLEDVTTKETIEFMSVETTGNYQKIGKFYINPKALEFGLSTLEKAIKSKCEYIIIDEIGRLELNNNGWATILEKILKTNKKIVFTVRKELLQKIIKKFNLSDFKLINIEP